MTPLIYIHFKQQTNSMKNNNQQRKFYVAEPSEYPMVQNIDFSTTQAEKQALKDAKKLHKLQLMNAFGASWKKHLNLEQVSNDLRQVFQHFVKYAK